MKPGEERDEGREGEEEDAGAFDVSFIKGKLGKRGGAGPKRGKKGAGDAGDRKKGAADKKPKQKARFHGCRSAAGCSATAAHRLHVSLSPSTICRLQILCIHGPLSWKACHRLYLIASEHGRHCLAAQRSEIQYLSSRRLHASGARTMARARSWTTRRRRTARGALGVAWTSAPQWPTSV
jgi:hypothetical protein